MNAARCACTIGDRKWETQSVPKAADIRPPALGEMVPVILLPRIVVQITAMKSQ